MKRVGKNHFKGATDVNTCKSTLRGASYATSEVEIKENQIISWDRGFDAEGNYVTEQFTVFVSEDPLSLNAEK